MFCLIMSNAKQLSFPEPKQHGGRRQGAGRKPSGPRAGLPHRARPKHSASHPVHVTMRARDGLPSLRSDALLQKALREAIACGHKSSFRVIHFSIQSNHLHLIVEANDTPSLSRGMQALSIRMVHAVHSALGTAGRVFSDRYHAHELRTPRETRNALLYVLQNWAKHGKGRGYDPASSASWFDGWSVPPPQPDEPQIVARPRTWLVTLGWRRHGLLRPGERPREKLASGVIA